MQGGKIRPTRYAHFEGHTDLCYSDDGKHIITCGSDGEVRVFEGLDDDDCKTHVVADCCHSIAFRDGHFLVGTDSNLVQAFTLEDGSPDGIVTRFTAPATHIVVSADGRRVACAGSDMTIRVHDPIAYKDKEFTGHKAPVLSVALDPKGEYLASSSCDGTVRVWALASGAVEATWAVLPQSNSLSASPTLCRLAFTPSGTLLVVPVGTKILLYDRDGWRAVGDLTYDRVTETISVVALSPCGTLVAGGCQDGTLVVWSLGSRTPVMVDRHPKGLAICGLAWSPLVAKRELAFVDVNGQLGTVVEVPVGGGIDGGGNSGSMAESPALGVMNGVGGADGEEEGEEDGEEEYSISKIKAELGFADDEAGTYLGLPSAATTAKQPTAGEAWGEGRPSVPSAPRVEGVRLPEVQKPFQPSMSPEHLTQRYMLWNNIGIVRQYTSDEESSIDVEFHDSSVHHSLYINNSVGHTMAALSSQVLALAAESQEEQPSKLAVQQLSGGKEWHQDMPDGEEILALTVGTDWVAVATDQRNLRIFGTCGTHRELMALPGPVVCLAGQDDLLMAVFHSGVGVSGDQCMSALVLSIGGERHPAPKACPLALSPRGFLAWAGFTDEGTPMTMDSAGIVRIINYRLGFNWTTILDTRTHARSKADHYFLVGASEVQGNVRCVFCKGARFPPLLPKPHVSLLGFKVPVCEGHTEKGELEEQLARTRLQLHTLTRLTQQQQGTGVEEVQEQADRLLQEGLIKLFALACRSERECRAVEVCRLMPSVSTIQLAIKYAAKLHLLALAERLGQVAAAKVEEEGEREARRRLREEEEQEEMRYSHTRWRGPGRRQQEVEQQQQQQQQEDDSYLPSITQEEEEEEDEEEEHQPKNPLLEAYAHQVNQAGSPSTHCSLLTQKNPFKKAAPIASPATTKRSIDVIDGFRRAMRKESPSVLKPVVRKPQQNKLKKQTNTGTSGSPSTGKENQLTLDSQPNLKPTNPFKKPQGEGEEVPPSPQPPPGKPRSALQLWLDDNVDAVKSAFPDVAEKELFVKAALMFKELDAEVKQKYKTLAAGTPKATPTEERKRPREEEGREEAASVAAAAAEALAEEQPLDKKCKGLGSGLGKLSAFVFKKDS